jgi:hypothetical protein
MRERYPSSGLGFVIVMLIFIVATVLILSSIASKFPPF